MNKVVEHFEVLNQKAKNLSEAMTILPHKLQCINELKHLTEASSEIKELQNSIKASLLDHDQALKEKYRQTTDATRRVQMKMMHLLLHLDGKEGADQQASKAPSNFLTVKEPLPRPSIETPVIVVMDYDETPSVKKKKSPMRVIFEAEITSEEFNKIPSYMRGRITLIDLTEFLSNGVIRTFNNKYRIMMQQRSTLKAVEKALQTTFKNQASLFEGEKFITTDDIARIMDKSVDRKCDKYLQMLRHLHIIREARKGSVCCYIWLKDL